MAEVMTSKLARGTKVCRLCKSLVLDVIVYVILSSYVVMTRWNAGISYFNQMLVINNYVCAHTVYIRPSFPIEGLGTRLTITCVVVTAKQKSILAMTEIPSHSVIAILVASTGVVCTFIDICRMVDNVSSKHHHHHIEPVVICACSVVPVIL